jgi:methylenetetrahydrofolate dehydrogenase (NADP+)/methenyltetrahydrofolate cyclohydrolase
MAARILDGNAIARDLRASLRLEVERRVAAGLRPPGLAVILVGNDPASEVYVAALNRCTKMGQRLCRRWADDLEHKTVTRQRQWRNFGWCAVKGGNGRETIDQRKRRGNNGREFENERKAKQCREWLATPLYESK